MLVNERNKKMLTNRVKKCQTITSKMIGAMFSSPLNGKALYFVFASEQYNPLHMLFVFQQLDIIFLDKNEKVVELKKGLKPFTFYNPKKKSKFIIEARAGTIEKAEIKEGDKILLVQK